MSFKIIPNILITIILISVVQQFTPNVFSLYNSIFLDTVCTVFKDFLQRIQALYSLFYVHLDTQFCKDVFSTLCLLTYLLALPMQICNVNNRLTKNVCEMIEKYKALKIQNERS